MAFTTLCAVVATLRILPDKNQFFQYDHVSMSCEQKGPSSQWIVKRNTSKHKNEDSFLSNETNEYHWYIDAIYHADTGVYWCQSAAGECSEAVNISVTYGDVILESPALPVTEGETLTLRCSTRTPTSNLTADFYKDGLFFRSSLTGNTTISHVSKSDEGLYRCNISGVRGQSPESWIGVREATRTEVPNSPSACFRLPVLVVCLCLVFAVAATLYCLWRCRKGKLDPDLPYTDVTIIPGGQPNRITDLGAVPTFYSSVKPGNV